MVIFNVLLPLFRLPPPPQKNNDKKKPTKIQNQNNLLIFHSFRSIVRVKVLIRFRCDRFQGKKKHKRSEMRLDYALFCLMVHNSINRQ